jgi:hypothetical protein
MWEKQLIDQICVEDVGKGYPFETAVDRPLWTKQSAAADGRNSQNMSHQSRNPHRDEPQPPDKDN